MDKKQLYKVRNVAIQTLIDQNFGIPEGYLKLTYDDFLKLEEKGKHHLMVKDVTFPRAFSGKTEGSILVFFEESLEFTNKILEARVNQLKKEYPKIDLIIIVPKVYGAKKSKIKDININSFENVYVLPNILPFDIMKSDLMPEIHLLSDSDKKLLLDVCKIPLHNFIKIKVDDPSSIRFGAKVDDVFKIIRNKGKEITYKVVI